MRRMKVFSSTIGKSVESVFLKFNNFRKEHPKLVYSVGFLLEILREYIIKKLP